ncbi:MAG: hypothetical protein ACI85Q_002835 [Salibacteraceae bacterium]|jgi:hypothetical protein
MQLTASISTTLKWITVLLFLFLSSPSIAQRTLGLDKSGRVKRIHFYEGHSIRVKLITNEKISGKLDGIFDSSFVIDGRKILLSEVTTVFSTRKTLRFLGGALMVSGAFYFTLDALNNLFNYSTKGYVFSNSVWAPSAAAAGSGAILYYFSIRRTPVHGQNNFRIYNTTPLPINESNSSAKIIEPKTDSIAAIATLCENGLTATLKTLQLDGCTWILELPSGEQLEPVNYRDYITEAEIEDQKPVKVSVVFGDTKSASICMIGRTVAISCMERLK